MLCQQFLYEFGKERDQLVGEARAAVEVGVVAAQRGAGVGGDPPEARDAPGCTRPNQLLTLLHRVTSIKQSSKVDQLGSNTLIQ